MVADLSVAAQAIETLCTVEMREPGESYGVIRPLYEAGKEAQGGFPTELAVKALTDRVGKGDVVVIATGAYFPNYMPRGENDGPLGAASLAYALNLGLGAIPLVLCEEPIVEPVEASCQAIGLGVRPLEVASKIPYAVAVESFPTDESAEQAAQHILGNLEPRAIISVEKLGLNSKGVAHSATGGPAMEGRARIEVLVSAARDAGVLTIGVGDNGNEIGFGVISDAVREYKEYGRVCRCPCGGGLACVDVCDVLITASVSNWGAYGLSAGLAVALEKPYLLHDYATELRMIDACVSAGACDGAYGMYTVSVDGVPGPLSGYLVEMLRFIVEKNLEVREERNF
jgi:hypothetical protein